MLRNALEANQARMPFFYVLYTLRKLVVANKMIELNADHPLAAP